MSKIRYLIASCIALGVFTSSAFAAEATMGVDVASSYIFRGAAVNDSFVAQPYLEVGGFPKIDGLSVGVWGNLDLDDDSSGTPKSGEFSEVDLYASYDLPFGCDLFTTSLSYTEYLYPNSELDADREIGLVTAFDTLLNPSLGVHVGIDGGIQEQVYFELGLGHDVELSEDLTLSLGGVVAALVQSQDSTADDGISYANLSAGLSYGLLSAKIITFFETDDDVLEVDEEVQGIIGLALDF